jgi:hypothetical protein
VAFRGVGVRRGLQFRKRICGGSAVGSLAFPCQALPPDQLSRASSSRRSALTASRHVLFKDTPDLLRPFLRLRPKPKPPFRAPLLRFFKERPSADISSECPLPVARGSGLPLPERVPSLSFLPTSTVCSTRSLAGLLHPATSHGVRLVSSRPPTSAGRPTLLRGAVYPPKRFPLRQRVSLSPGSLPSRRWILPHRSVGLSPTSRLCSTAESVVAGLCCHRPLTRCSLGLSSTCGSHRAPWSPRVRSPPESGVSRHRSVASGGAAFRPPPLRMGP